MFVEKAHVLNILKPVNNGKEIHRIPEKTVQPFQKVRLKTLPGGPSILKHSNNCGSIPAHIGTSHALLAKSKIADLLSSGK